MTSSPETPGVSHVAICLSKTNPESNRVTIDGGPNLLDSLKSIEVRAVAGQPVPTVVLEVAAEVDLEIAGAAIGIPQADAEQFLAAGYLAIIDEIKPEDLEAVMLRGNMMESPAELTLDFLRSLATIKE